MLYNNCDGDIVKKTNTHSQSLRFFLSDIYRPSNFLQNRQMRKQYLWIVWWFSMMMFNDCVQGWCSSIDIVCVLYRHVWIDNTSSTGFTWRGDLEEKLVKNLKFNFNCINLIAFMILSSILYLQNWEINHKFAFMILLQ